MGLLKQLRTHYHPKLPHALNQLTKLSVSESSEKNGVSPQLATLFPHLHGPSVLSFQPGNSIAHTPKRVGVVFSGGPAPGGHNVITGLYDALKKLNPENRLFGFRDGPKGIIDNKAIELTDTMLEGYRNQGGFDLLGTGRTKIDTPEQFAATEATVKSLQLDALVVVGGDDSNTNAAMLADYFEARKCPVAVIGVPKTIDGDLKGNEIEISFGFDTASKTYSEIIGNLLRDALSNGKYYYFVKLMGRSASNITLECALQTHPNIALISEEVAAQKKTFSQIIHEICDTICARAAIGKNYGVILIPEGIVEFIPEFKQLISELNTLLAPDKPHSEKLKTLNVNDQLGYIAPLLSEHSLHCFQGLPRDLQVQLMLDRDSHGNVQVSKIETERLFIDMVRSELKQRKASGTYSGSFSAQPLFCGYEGRSCTPSNFDAHYCYALGHVAALLADAKKTGYICFVKNLARPVEEWQIGARNLVTMMTTEKRLGKEKPVIKKAFVELSGQPFHLFQEQRQNWLLEDDYCYPGPIQFFGSHELTDATTITLRAEAGMLELTHARRYG